MPYLRIETSVSKANITPELANEAAHLVSQVSGKPLQYCAASIIPEVAMSFGGTGEPCAQAYFMCIGCISPAQNAKSSKLIADFVTAKLGVPADRMYIEFSDTAGSNVGWQCKTF